MTDQYIITDASNKVISRHFTRPSLSDLPPGSYKLKRYKSYWQTIETRDSQGCGGPSHFPSEEPVNYQPDTDPLEY